MTRTTDFMTIANSIDNHYDNHNDDYDYDHQYDYMAERQYINDNAYGGFRHVKSYDTDSENMMF